MSQNQKRLSKSEWNFRRLDASEAQTCMLYEYARESATVIKWKAALDQERGAARQEGGTTHPVSEDYKFASVVSAMHPSLRAYLHAKTPSKPWCKLKKCERKRLRRLTQGHCAQAIARLDLGTAAYFYEMYAERPETEQPVSWLSPTGVEFTVLSINWPLYSNDQIVKSFGEWVGVARPGNIPEVEARKGRPKSPATALDYLAVVRLLHNYSVNEAVSRFGKDWPQLKAWGEDSGRLLYRARKKAKVVFKDLFPFLPKTEVPTNWQLKSKRDDESDGDAEGHRGRSTRPH